MDRRLKSILRKIATQQPLSEEDIAAARDLVDDGTGADSGEGPRPLWAWVRRQQLLNQR